MGKHTSLFTGQKRTLWVALSMALISMLMLVACGNMAAASSSTTSAPPAAATQQAPTATPAPATQPLKVVVVQMLEKPEGHYFFQPDKLTITAGTTVVWYDNSDAPHTVTSDSGAPTAFNTTSNVTEGKTFALTFNNPGAYNYHCNIHPNMKALITVTAS